MSEIEEMSTADASVYSPTTLVPGAILVIDDNAAIREALAEILALVTEVAVYAAANGHEGLQLLQERQDVALVLLDMNMPVMNGEETYQNLQQFAPDVKVIVSTSLSPAEVQSRLGEQELPAYLQKPYDVTTLLDVVQSVATSSG